MGVLVQYDQALSEFPDFSHDDVGDVLFFSGLEKQVVGFLDYRHVLEDLSLSLAEPVVVDPEKEASDDEGFVRITQSVQLQDDVLFQELFDWQGLFTVNNLAEAWKADAGEGSSP